MARRRGPAGALYLAAELPGLLRRPFPDAAENLCVERWWDAVLGVAHPRGQTVDASQVP